MKVSEKRVMRKVERGFCHSLPVSDLGPREKKTAVMLAACGYLRKLPARGRFFERYVVTGNGSWAIGTFDSADRYFHQDVELASEKARKAA
jgi:hypothetical protein